MLHNIRTGPERCSVFSEQCSVFGVLFGIFFVFVRCLFCSALSVRAESCSVFGVLFGGSSRTFFCSVFCSVGAGDCLGIAWRLPGDYLGIAWGLPWNSLGAARGIAWGLLEELLV